MSHAFGFDAIPKNAQDLKIVKKTAHLMIGTDHPTGKNKPLVAGAKRVCTCVLIFAQGLTCHPERLSRRLLVLDLYCTSK